MADSGCHFCGGYINLWDLAWFEEGEMRSACKSCAAREGIERRVPEEKPAPEMELGLLRRQIAKGEICHEGEGRVLVLVSLSVEDWALIKGEAS